MATLTLNFTAPTTNPVNGYIVKYRKVGEVPYITVTPNPTSSPVVITGLDLVSYEGTVQADCGGIVSDEIAFIASTIPDLPTFTFDGPWQFSDTNALNTTAVRNYSATALPTQALWSVNNEGYGLRIDWEDSTNCGGTNDKTQSGTATASITVNTAQSIGVSWTGIAEMQASTFEQMTISIDGVVIGSATSPGGNLGCEMGNIVSTNLYPGGYPLSIGSHTITITTSTNDPLYHVGSYYAFTFTKLS